MNLITGVVLVPMIMLSILSRAYAEEWVSIIDSSGPIGIADVGKSITLCGNIQLDGNSRRLSSVAGSGVVAILSKADYGDNNNLNSQQSFGDCEVRLEFAIGKGSNSGIKLQQRYEIQLYDSHGIERPTATDCGGIYPHWVFGGEGQGLKYIDEGIPPASNAAKPAGQWQSLQIVFRAPRFNSHGTKTHDAMFVSVVLNGKEIHRDVRVDSPTGNASTPLPEVPEAPIYLQMDHGPVAFRNVRVKVLAVTEQD
ncbi:MAG: DUF1080 domain-containing protein [Pirellulaceae bacterium]